LMLPIKKPQTKSNTYKHLTIEGFNDEGFI
jgi:hypothetical protein